jgi:integrase
VHPTTQQALDIYRNVREQLPTPDDALFVSLWGKRLAYVTVDAIFLRLARSIGLRGEPGQRGARMHDLRHTFAVRSLEQCGHDDKAVARHLAALSTYLGHVHATSTYWYLQATPSLMKQIANAGEALYQGDAP